MSTSKFKNPLLFTVLGLLLTPFQMMAQTSASADEWSVTIDTKGIWIDSDPGANEDLTTKGKDGKFHLTAYVFGSDGLLKVTEYEGLYLDMKKNEKSYQYKFDDQSLILKDGDKTERIWYELKYHSLLGMFMVLHREGKKVELVSAANDKQVKEMIDDFEKISKK